MIRKKKLSFYYGFCFFNVSFVSLGQHFVTQKHIVYSFVLSVTVSRVRWAPQDKVFIVRQQ